MGEGDETGGDDLQVAEDPFDVAKLGILLVFLLLLVGRAGSPAALQVDLLEDKPDDLLVA